MSVIRTYRVWLNDAGYEPSGGVSAVPQRRPATTVEVEAALVQVNDYGTLGFYGPDGRGLTQCFARGHWTRWQRLDD